MYAVLKERHSLTVIDHCCVCHFFSSSEKNLLTAGGSHLKVFRINDVQTGKDGEKGETTKRQKLEQLGWFNLSAAVVSMAPVKIGNNVRDSLLLAFADAKLAIVEYDPPSHDIRTVSLHFYEDEDLKAGFHTNVYSPHVRVDPEQRCAAMLIYGRHLVILPFKQELPVTVPEETPKPSESVGSVLPSYVIDLQSPDLGICNITDLHFLHGYQEPTILLLYEPVQTYAGRIAVRQDTHGIAAISLNMAERVHPIIWSTRNLPFDCNKLYPVPKPLGGVLVVANNSLIYLNQSVPPYGVALNSMTETSTMFPLRNQEDVVLTLENSVATFISYDKLVFSLKGGELYVITFLTDGLRSVRSFHFDKAAGSVLASCITSMGDEFLFLGSRLGNSILLKYTEKQRDDDGIGIPAPNDPPPHKKRKLDQSNLYDDVDDLEMYGTREEKPSGEITAYSFEVLDSLLNIGPCADVAVGEPAFLSEEFVDLDSANPDLELVCCSGYGKNGALTVLQRTVRPQVVTTFELPGCTDIWTVYAKDENEDTDEGFHSFLILSREDSTMVLKTEAEISEIDNSGFNTQSLTVLMENIGNYQFILQVCPTFIRLVEGANKIQEIPMTSTAPVVFCSVDDPFFVLLLSDGSLVYGKLTVDQDGPHLVQEKITLNGDSQITACCAFKDSSGIFTTRHIKEEEVEVLKPSIASTPKLPEAHSKWSTEEDEDELLYGENSTFTDSEKQPEIPEPAVEHQTEIKSNEVSHWCALARENGALEIYSVPNFKLAFVCNNFSTAPQLLIDSSPNQPISVGNKDPLPVIKELLIVGLGCNDARPFLLAVTEHDLFIYEAFEFANKPVADHLSIRFKKHTCTLCWKENEESQIPNFSSIVENKGTKISKLRPFNNVSSYKGVFVCGRSPHWLFVSPRGCLFAHPMTVDGPVPFFAPFHNINCPYGFLYFNNQGELRIAMLPTHFMYDAPWPVRKVALRCTPHRIVYSRDCKVYAVATSYLEVQDKIPKFSTEEREFEEVKRDPRYVFPSKDRFCIQLVSPVSWEIVPNTRLELEEFEHVSAMKLVNLASEETHSGVKPLLVTATSYNFGEDVTARGRILIHDIIEVVPEPGQPLTKNKFKCLYDKEQKGPVTAFCAVAGHLVTAVGQKIYVWKFTDNNDLVGIAFIDTEIFVIDMISIRNLVLCGDIAKSIQVLRFQEKFKTLSLVGRDIKPLEVYSIEFLVDGRNLGYIACDSDQNLLIYSYQPEALESFGGQRLLTRGDINVGSHATKMFRVKTRYGASSTTNKQREQRQVTYLATIDGGLNVVLPMTEKTYRRLMMLQNKMHETLQHLAGLNPKACRALNLQRRPLTNAHRNILDGTFLDKFLSLSFIEKQDLAKKIGTTSSQIIEDLMDIEKAVSHF